MLTRLGTFTFLHRRVILALTGLGVVLSGVLGAGVLDRLTTGGFVDPSSESESARVTLLRELDQGAANVVLLVSARQGDVDTPAVAAEGGRITDDLAAEPGVEQVWSYWSPGSPAPLRSDDGRQGLVLARIGGDDDAVQRVVERISPEYASTGPVVSTEVGGTAEVARQAQEQIRDDLERAELLSMPVLLVLLVLVFGSLLAGALPLAIGAVAVVGTLLVLRVLTAVTDVSLFALNLTTALGLGLAIDYSLFLVARYREERRGHATHEDAVRRSVETAGRTVLFSAVTVAASLSALLIFPTVFLRSFAYAGIAVVAMAALGAVVVLPALLATVGRNLERWPAPFRGVPTARHRRTRPGFWHRLATAVMARPVLTGGAVLAVLLVLGSPFLGVRFSLPDHRVLPEGTSSRSVQETIDTRFARGEGNNLLVVGSTREPAATAGLDAYASRLSGLDGVSRVDGPTGSYAGGLRVAAAADGGADFSNGDRAWLSVVPTVEALSPEGEDLVADIRGLDAPFPVEVGGASAALVDTKAALFDRLPVALAVVAAVTFVVLFLFTGGLLVPVKGIVLNLLSLTATFGAMVWVFQDGRFSELLQFTPTGTLDVNMPILMFCVAFGLSMDYEVFLLSRIKEHYDVTGDNEAAVAQGLESTGRIVTAAAALLGVVFLAFATSGISFVKLMGIGTALAVVMDATLVRGVLVPALMRLAGRANWWAPAPLRAFHERFGLSESGSGTDRAPRRSAAVPVRAPAPDAPAVTLASVEPVRQEAFAGRGSGS